MDVHTTPIVFVTSLNWSYVPNGLYRRLQMKWNTVYINDFSKLSVPGSNYVYDPCQRPKESMKLSPFLMTFFINSQSAVDEMKKIKHSWIWNSDAFYILIVENLDHSIRNLVKSIWAIEFIHK